MFATINTFCSHRDQFWLGVEYKLKWPINIAVIIHESGGTVTSNCGGGSVNCDAEILTFYVFLLDHMQRWFRCSLQTAVEKSMDVTVSLLHPDNPGITQELVLEKRYLVPRRDWRLRPLYYTNYNDVRFLICNFISLNKCKAAIMWTSECNYWMSYA